MFAGPNGSGKSYLIDEVGKEINLGYLINADLVEEKLKDRFYRSLDLLHAAFMSSHRAFIVDSTLEVENMVIIEKNGNDIIQNDVIPGWVTKYLLDKLNTG